MSQTPSEGAEQHATDIGARLLAPLGEVRSGESGNVLLLLFNIWLLFVGYYVLKTVREPLILTTGGAELKSYASAVQAGVLALLVPLYGVLATRVTRFRLVVGLTVFFIAGIELSVAGWLAQIPGLGFAFYVFVGIYSVSLVAQFWSYTNDIYTTQSGERLFPIIAVGATAGAPLGSLIAGALSERGLDPAFTLQIPAVLLAVGLGVYFLVERRSEKASESAAEPAPPVNRANGFALVLKSPYIRLIALLLILLNFVNTTGEYILSVMVVEDIDAAVAAGEFTAAEKGAQIGAFYGYFFTTVNIVTVIIQAFIVSRIVKYIGIAGVLFALPIVAFGVYGLAAAGVAFAVFQKAKMAENSTDYSVMNTAKAMLWLVTSREEKYVAKQTVDTFMVRLGDVLSALLVFVGVTYFGFGTRAFAGINLLLICAWFGLAVLLWREYRRLSDERVEAADTALS